MRIRNLKGDFDNPCAYLSGDSEFKPIRRTNGIGLPGYSAGWFKLANGEKALLFVTDRGKVVYMPTTDGYSVLLSTVNPEEFLESLNKEWGDHQG